MVLVHYISWELLQDGSWADDGHPPLQVLIFVVGPICLVMATSFDFGPLSINCCGGGGGLRRIIEDRGLNYFGPLSINYCGGLRRKNY